MSDSWAEDFLRANPDAAKWLDERYGRASSTPMASRRLPSAALSFTQQTPLATATAPSGLGVDGQNFVNDARYGLQGSYQYYAPPASSLGPSSQCVRTPTTTTEYCRTRVSRTQPSTTLSHSLGEVHSALSYQQVPSYQREFAHQASIAGQANISSIPNTPQATPPMLYTPSSMSTASGISIQTPRTLNMSAMQKFYSTSPQMYDQQCYSLPQQSARSFTPQAELFNDNPAFFQPKAVLALNSPGPLQQQLQNQVDPNLLRQRRILAHQEQFRDQLRMQQQQQGAHMQRPYSVESSLQYAMAPTSVQDRVNFSGGNQRRQGNVTTSNASKFQQCIARAVSGAPRMSTPAPQNTAAGVKRLAESFADDRCMKRTQCVDPRQLTKQTTPGPHSLQQSALATPGLSNFPTGPQCVSLGKQRAFQGSLSRTKGATPQQQQHSPQFSARASTSKLPGAVKSENLTTASASPQTPEPSAAMSHAQTPRASAKQAARPSPAHSPAKMQATGSKATPIARVVGPANHTRLATPAQRAPVPPNESRGAAPAMGTSSAARPAQRAQTVGRQRTPACSQRSSNTPRASSSTQVVVLEAESTTSTMSAVSLAQTVGPASNSKADPFQQLEEAQNASSFDPAAFIEAKTAVMAAKASPPRPEARVWMPPDNVCAALLRSAIGNTTAVEAATRFHGGRIAAQAPNEVLLVGPLTKQQNGWALVEEVKKYMKWCGASVGTNPDLTLPAEESFGLEQRRKWTEEALGNSSSRAQNVVYIQA